MDEHTNSAIEEYDGSPDMPFIAVVGLDYHYDRGRYVGWSDETLCFGDAESHPITEDDWEDCVKSQDLEVILFWRANNGWESIVLQ
jgi:hypothetical protein